MKLSIIMPCFNVANTLVRALDSIIMQRVNFEYEILVVDDASTDNTVSLACHYAELHPQVKVLQNKVNKGNAYTYYTGLRAAQGKYFCVLDGDDYYTIPDKLQRQVDFLDNDTAEEYVAAATQYIIDLGDNMVSIPDRSTYQEFSYADFLTQHSGYYHTATYMYRNIFKGNVPAEIGDVLYRGDTPRTTFHLMYSGKKIKILDFVGSAYTFEFGGLWSSLKQKQQFEYQINYQKKHRDNVTTDFERSAADKLIEFNQKKMESAQDDLRRYPAISIDNALSNLIEYAKKFAFGQKDFVLKHAYYSSYIDTLCASLGYVDQIRNPDHVQWRKNQDNVCIINGVLNPHGGGIFAEIDELIGIYRSKHVYLIVTNMKQVPETASEILSKHSNLTIVCPPADTQEHFAWLRKAIVQIAPYRSYCYCSHSDAYGAALIQKGVCENVALFSFDHGYLCGISNPNLDTIIAKRSVDYWMLKKRFGDKVIFIPTWNEGAVGCENLSYKPFADHNNLITASGAARFYKVDGRPPYRYIDIILALLKQTQGIHYHFGELPDSALEEIREKSESIGVRPEQFIHIPWSDNIPLELLKNHVDIFIEPFPVVSYKLTLEVLSIGMPVIVQQGLTRMSIADFVPEDTLIWHEQQEFIQMLTDADEVFLNRVSLNAVDYFKSHHSVQQVSRLLMANEGISAGKQVDYPDDSLMDITSSLRLFGNDYRISVMNPASYLEKKKAEERARKEREQKEKERLEKIKKDKEKKEKERQKKAALEKIAKIRSSYSFRLGFACTFLFRLLKQLLVHVICFGPIQGIRKLKEERLLFYYRKNYKDELYTLQHSAAFKAGELLAKPYRYLRYGTRNKQIKRLNDQINRQQKELAEIRKLLQEQMKHQKAAEQKLLDTINDLNETHARVNKDIRQYQAIGQEELLRARKERLDVEQKFKLADDALRYAQDCLNANCAEQSQMISELSKTRNQLRQEEVKILQEVRRGTLIQRESLWAQIYNNSIQGSEWFKNVSMSPGRWAVGYPLLYVLYCTLEHLNPNNILEMGLGQSTKMMTQYALAHPETKHTVVEQSADWAKFFSQSNSIAPNTSIQVLECELRDFRDAGPVRMYQGFEKITQNQKYDLICIDAPSAEGMDQYSRVDVLKLLPHGLRKNFVIILDDCNRTGENNTAEAISSLLEESGIDFSQGKYQGEKLFRIWTSRNFSFLCTL